MPTEACDRTMISPHEYKPRGVVFTYIHSELNYTVGQLAEIRIELLWGRRMSIPCIYWDQGGGMKCKNQIKLS